MLQHAPPPPGPQPGSRSLPETGAVTTRHRAWHTRCQPRPEPGTLIAMVTPSMSQHYSDNGVASPERYAAMVSEDRALRLARYEVYRFGGHELAAGGLATTNILDASLISSSHCTQRRPENGILRSRVPA